MSGVLVLVYTTIGGVLGAGLTQYITHVRDRRAARALVVERLTEAEEAYAALRWPLPGDEQWSRRSRMARPLGSLEAAGLTAGVPRTILSRYIRSCLIYEDSRRVLHGAQLFVDQLAKSVSDQANKVRENGNAESVRAAVSRITDKLENICAGVSKIDDPAFRLHDAALEELGLALWHPVKLQLRRRKLRANKRLAERLEKSSRDQAKAVREMNILCEEVAPGKFRLKAAESSTADQSLIRLTQPV